VVALAGSLDHVQDPAGGCSSYWRLLNYGKALSTDVTDAWTSQMTT
jgi:hypothetical protein